MTDVLAHVDGVGGDGRRWSGESAAHGFENFFLLFRLPSLDFSGGVLHIIGEGREISVNPMSVWTCASPGTLVVKNVEFGLFLGSLCKNIYLRF